MKMKVSQSCPSLCDSMDCTPLGSSVHGILQARILEWVAISFSKRIEPRPPALQADSLPSESPGNHPHNSSQRFLRCSSQFIILKFDLNKIFQFFLRLTDQKFFDNSHCIL